MDSHKIFHLKKKTTQQHQAAFCLLKARFKMQNEKEHFHKKRRGSDARLWFWREKEHRNFLKLQTTGNENHRSRTNPKAEVVKSISASDSTQSAQEWMVPKVFLTKGCIDLMIAAVTPNYILVKS